MYVHYETIYNEGSTDVFLCTVIPTPADYFVMFLNLCGTGT